MALWDDVKARYSTDFLRQVTNPDAAGAAGGVDAIGVLAAADVEADFLTFANITYSDSDPRHVSIGVAGVIKKLHQGRGLPADEDRSERKEWQDLLKGLASSRGISKVRPSTNSRYTPSNPNPLGECLRPPFDPSRFTGIVPNEPN